MGEADAGALAAAAGLSGDEEAVVFEGADVFVGRWPRRFAAATGTRWDRLRRRGRPRRGHPRLSCPPRARHPLDAPGTTDITAGVDFAWIARRAEECGLIAFPSVTQFEALKALGFEDWAAGELGRQHELLEARDAEAVRVWSARSRASLLVDPAALGRFRWLVLASPGLPAPGWLS